MRASSTPVFLTLSLLVGALGIARDAFPTKTAAHLDPAGRALTGISGADRAHDAWVQAVVPAAKLTIGPAAGIAGDTDVKVPVELECPRRREKQGSSESSVGHRAESGEPLTRVGRLNLCCHPFRAWPQ